MQGSALVLAGQRCAVCNTHTLAVCWLQLLAVYACTRLHMAPARAFYFNITLAMFLQASHDIKKQRLGPGGAPVSTTEVHNVHQTQKKQKDGQNVTCASCYGAESEQYKCCNTCDDVRAICRMQQQIGACSSRDTSCKAPQPEDASNESGFWAHHCLGKISSALVPCRSIASF